MSHCLQGAMTSCFQVCLERNREQEASFGLFNLASSSLKDELVSFVIPMLTAGFATWYLTVHCKRRLQGLVCFYKAISFFLLTKTYFLPFGNEKET